MQNKNASLCYPIEYFNYIEGEKTEGSIYYHKGIIFKLTGKWWIEEKEEQS